jgi:hypothetical protein
MTTTQEKQSVAEILVQALRQAEKDLRDLEVSEEWPKRDIASALDKIESAFKEACYYRTDSGEWINIDIWLLVQDETEYWNLDPQHMAMIERIEGVYLYDKNQVTHCCEVTASYCLLFVENRAVFKPDVSEEDIDEIDGIIRGVPQEQDVTYMHCHTVDDIPDRKKHHYGSPEVPLEDVPYDEQIESVLEYCQANCLI